MSLLAQWKFADDIYHYTTSPCVGNTRKYLSTLDKAQIGCSAVQLVVQDDEMIALILVPWQIITAGEPKLNTRLVDVGKVNLIDLFD